MHLTHGAPALTRTVPAPSHRFLRPNPVPPGCPQSSGQCSLSVRTLLPPAHCNACLVEYSARFVRQALSNRCLADDPSGLDAGTRSKLLPIFTAGFHPASRCEEHLAAETAQSWPIADLRPRPSRPRGYLARRLTLAVSTGLFALANARSASARRTAEHA